MEPLGKILSIIEKKFRDGFGLNEDVIHFAESTLGMDYDDIVDTVISGDPEGTGIPDLIISPDDGMRKEIERYIPPEGIGAAGRRELLKRAEKSILTAVIKREACNTGISCDLIPGLLARFIRKLILGKKVPCKDILSSGAGSGPGNTYLLVYMRKVFPDENGLRGLDLCGLIGALAGSGLSEREVRDAMDLLSAVLKKYPGEADIFSMVTAERSFWLKMLERKRFVDDTVVKYSMEFVMMQRINPEIFSARDIKRRIDTAGMILDLLGRGDKKR